MIYTAQGNAQWDWGVQCFRLIRPEGDITAPDIGAFEALVTLTEDERQMLVDERAYCDENGVGL